MATALRHPQRLQSASSCRQTYSGTWKASRSFPVAQAQYRQQTPCPRLAKPSSAASSRRLCARQKVQESPCKVPPAPLPEFAQYDCLSVNDSATPAKLTHIFHHSREMHRQYELGQVLGKGSFGVVRLGRARNTKELCAIKSLPKLPPLASRQSDGEASLSTYLTKLVDEVDTMVTMSATPESVQYYGSYEDDTHLHIIMEVRLALRFVCH